MSLNSCRPRKLSVENRMAVSEKFLQGRGALSAEAGAELDPGAIG